MSKYHLQYYSVVYDGLEKQVKKIIVAREKDSYFYYLSVDGKEQKVKLIDELINYKPCHVNDIINDMSIDEKSRIIIKKAMFKDDLDDLLGGDDVL